MKPRINLFGGPGVGKSTFAAKLFAHLKKQGTNVELVQEVVKQWVYEGRQIQPWDCVPIFGQQFEAEQRLLQNGVKHIITDSPLFLQCIYAKLIHGCPAYPELTNITERFNRKWPAINFFICRPDASYGTHGRYETEEKARVMDARIESMLEEHSIEYHSIRPDNDVDFEYCLHCLFCLDLLET